ncbi:MAG: hypothetical protein JW841_09110 [Deltaproteobacteria bacterium]|nr:hypothetical protein [Deltaproteobacteria bacterium]
MKRLLATISIFLLPLYNVRAEMGPMPGEERFASSMPQGQQTIGAALGFTQIGEDNFLQLTLKSELNLGPVGLGLQVPLRLRMPPDDKANDYYGIIRREDWDQKSEFLQVIRYVRLGHKRDNFYLRVGELAADIGHGTIVKGYINNLDAATFRVGSTFDVNTDYGGIETLISDLGSIYDSSNTRSRIFGTRAYFKPLVLVDPSGLLNILAVGFSLVSDVNAPAIYKMADTSGQSGSSVTATPLVKNGAYVVEQSIKASVYGFDLEVQALHTAIIDLIPYTDLNFINQAGWGWHLGVLTTLKMPIGFSLTIPIRLEYRRFASDYLPAYFNSFYEIERFSYKFDNKAAPKVVTVRNLPSGKGINGFLGELAFDFVGLFQIGASYEAYQGSYPNLQVFLSVPALEVVQFKAFYARTNIENTEDIFKLDNRSYAVAQARYQLVTYTYLVGRITQQWELNTDPNSRNYGKYESKREWNVGIEIAVTL